MCRQLRPFQLSGRTSRPRQRLSSLGGNCVNLGGISNGRGLSDGRNSSSTAWEQIEIRPLPAAIEALPFASASTHTPRGVVAVRWSHSDSTFALNATVPVGSVANVALPTRLGDKQLSIVSEATVLVWGDGAYASRAWSASRARRKSRLPTICWCFQWAPAATTSPRRTREGQ